MSARSPGLPDQKTSPQCSSVCPHSLAFRGSPSTPIPWSPGPDLPAGRRWLLCDSFEGGAQREWARPDFPTRLQEFHSPSHPGWSQERAKARAMSTGKLLCFSFPIKGLACPLWPGPTSLQNPPSSPQSLSGLSLGLSVSVSRTPGLGLWLSLGERSQGPQLQRLRQAARGPPLVRRAVLLLEGGGPRTLLRINLTRPPRTKEVASRGQRGGAWLSHPRRTASRNNRVRKNGVEIPVVKTIRGGEL